MDDKFSPFFTNYGPKANKDIPHETEELWSTGGDYRIPIVEILDRVAPAGSIITGWLVGKDNLEMVLESFDEEAEATLYKTLVNDNYNILEEENDLYDVGFEIDFSRCPYQDEREEGIRKIENPSPQTDWFMETFLRTLESYSRYSRRDYTQDWLDSLSKSVWVTYTWVNPQLLRVHWCIDDSTR